MQDFHFRIRFIGGPAAKEQILPEWQNIAMPDLVLAHGAFITVKPCAGTTSLRDAIVDKAIFHERNIASGAYTPAMELPFGPSDTLTPAEQDDEQLKDLAHQHFLRVRSMIKLLVDRWVLATRVPYTALACDIIPQGMPDAEAYRARLDEVGTISIDRVTVLDADKID